MAAAERLYAEHGLVAVSNRQISEAAGQGNVAAVGYHFGTRADLVRAIMRKHSEAIEEIRRRMAEETRGSEEVRDWVACLVRPATEHLATLGVPSW
ncbi:helix-turn-helix transcriptional regulator, partial [Streptomyces albiflaviniger]|nr:helix-turn-helix transcriptional regulator [Streptomyces albiflaviniger]